MEKNEILLLKELVQVDTREGRNLDAMNILKDYLKDIGIQAQIDEYESGKANLYASINKGNSEEAIALSGH